MNQQAVLPDKNLKKSYYPRIIKWVSIFLMLMMLIIFGMVWKVGSLLISTNKHNVGDIPAEFKGERFDITSSSGSRIAGWHLMNSSKKGVIVLVHGIHASRLIMLPRAKMLYEQGYSIVMIDLQSHGESSGNQITLGYREKDDVIASVDYAHKHHPEEKIGLIGISLGGASALLAAPQNVDAMIVESVFPDIIRAINNRVKDVLGNYSALPAQCLLWQIPLRIGISTDKLRPIDHLSEIHSPLFIMSGEQDHHTTDTETEEMFKQANNPKELWLVPGAGHIDLFEYNKVEYQNRVLSFFQQYL